MGYFEPKTPPKKFVAMSFKSWMLQHFRTPLSYTMTKEFEEEISVWTKQNALENALYLDIKPYFIMKREKHHSYDQGSFCWHCVNIFGFSAWFFYNALAAIWCPCLARPLNFWTNHEKLNCLFEGCLLKLIRSLKVSSSKF